MINVRFELKAKGLRGTQLRRKFKEVNATGLQAMGEQFHRVNLPRRFTYAGGRMLNFARRTPQYNERKKRQKGHLAPLVWSGTSRRLATSIKDIRIKSTDKRQEVRVRFTRARALNFRNPNSKINMRDEVTRVSPREHGPLLRTLQRVVTAGVKEI